MLTGWVLGHRRAVIARGDGPALLAFGIIVLIWQERHRSGLFGIQATGAITSWVPLFMFAFLFGLSTDYEVFILAASARPTTPTATRTTPSSTGSAPPAGWSPAPR